MSESVYSAEVGVIKIVCSISIFSPIGLQFMLAGAPQGHGRACTNLGAKKKMTNE